MSMVVLFMEPWVFSGNFSIFGYLRLEMEFLFGIIVYLELIIHVSTSYGKNAMNVDIWNFSENLTKWYQPWELCMLNSTNIGMDIREMRLGCMSSHRQPSHGFGPFRCRVGGLRSAKFPCRNKNDTSWYSRHHLRMAIEGYDDPSQHYLQDMLQNLVKANGSILLIGDSLMMELGQALTCEFEREGLIQKSWNVVLPGINIDINNKTHHIPIDKVVFNHLHPFQSSIDQVQKVISTRFFEQQQRSLLIIFNIGTWYNEYKFSTSNRELYNYHLKILFDLLNNIKMKFPSKRLGFLWAETPAQHWPDIGHKIQNMTTNLTGNGYYKGSFENTPCTPIKNNSNILDWRNFDRYTLLNNKTLQYFQGKNEIFGIIPLRSWSVPLWDIHPVHPLSVLSSKSPYYIANEVSDCTHFCWSPMMYQPIFHLLANFTSKL
eukprot:gene9389-19483_t